MRSFIKALAVAVLGCVLILMITPLLRRAWVLTQIEEAERNIDNGSFSAAEARLDRYEEWSFYYPAIHQQLLCSLIKSKVRQGKTDLAALCAESIRQCRPPSFAATSESAGTFLRSAPDWLVNEAFSLLSDGSQTWDPDIGRRILLDELWKMQAYDELVVAAKKILTRDPDDRAAKAKLALVANREQAPKLIERPGSTGSRPPRRPASLPATRPAVTVVKSAEAPPASGTFEEVTPDESREQKEQGLRAREAVLMTRLQARRKTLTDSRPVTEAERTRDTVRRSYEALKEQAMKLEGEANNSSGQQRISGLEQLRTMKGRMLRCQNDLAKAEEAAAAAEERRRAAFENDSEVRTLEQDLSAVRNELKNL